MKISFILYVFQVFSKNQYLTSHGIMYVFVDFLNFSNLTFHGIMYVFVDFRKKIFFTYFTLLCLPEPHKLLNAYFRQFAYSDF